MLIDDTNLIEVLNGTDGVVPVVYLTAPQGTLTLTGPNGMVSIPSQLHAINGGSISGTFTGNPVFTGSPVFSGSPFVEVTATGSSQPRYLSDRFSDFANVLDYGAGVGGDDALAIRNAIASGKKFIVVPPGTYDLKSTVPAWTPASNNVCIQVLAATDVSIIAYGATINVDNSISGPSPVTTFAFENNCKHCGLFGGTIVGNRTGLSSGENVAIAFGSVTDWTVKDVKITGTFLTAFAGVYAFDSLVENVVGYNLTDPWDIAHIENLTIRGCRFWAGSGPVTGLSLHYDVPTLSANSVTTEAGSARSLIGTVSNKLRIIDTLFDGFPNGIAIDAIQGALISRCIIRNGLYASSANAQGGFLLYRGSAAITAGLPCSDITIDDCDIYNNGVTAGGGQGAGINIVSSSGQVTDVTVSNSRIYDNTNTGIASTLPSSVGGLTIINPDFRSRSGGGLQTANISPLLLTGVISPAGAPLSINYVGNVSPQAALYIEGTTQSGVADADEKSAVLRLTDNQNSGGAGGGIEFGGRRASGGTGVTGSGYFASLKGSLVDGSNNTLGTLDVYLRNVNTDTSLTKVGSFTSAGLNSMAVGATTPSTGAFTTLSASSTVSGAGFTTWAASPPAIGGTTPAAITGTSVTGTTAVSAPAGATVGSNTVSGVILHMDGAASHSRSIQFETAGSPRWIVQTDQTTESGSNTGSEFNIFAMTDGGSINNTPLTINRSTGLVTLAQGAVVASVTIGTSAGPIWSTGTGVPSSTEPKGSMFTRTDGGVGTTLYVSQGGGTWNAVSGV